MITKLKVELKIYEDQYAQAEIMNRSFRSVYPKEKCIGRMGKNTNNKALEDIRVEIGEV